MQLVARQASEPRHAIISGAASGLGRALSLRLAAQGKWRLALLDVNDSGNQITCDLVQAAGAEAQAYRLDVADAAAWQALVGQLQKGWPRLDLLINNAGVCGAGEVGNMPLADWNWIINTNLLGTIHGCHACIPWLKQNQAGANILNIASITAVCSPPSLAAYNVSKAGVLSLSETLYGELRRHGVGVTVACPWFFPTALMDQGRFQREAERQFGQEMMQQSPCTADQVAADALAAAWAGRLYAKTGGKAWLRQRFKQLLPALFHQVLASKYETRFFGESGSP